jgi:hypothetical protein
MEAGFIADVSEATVLQQTWVRGIPQKRWIGGLKVDRKNCVPVRANRCKNCGFLKFYAQREGASFAAMAVNERGRLAEVRAKPRHRSP